MSVGIVAFMSLNSCRRHRVLALFILTLFIPCSASCYFVFVTHTFALFSGVVILTCDLRPFQLMYTNFYLKGWSVA